MIPCVETGGDTDQPAAGDPGLDGVTAPVLKPGDEGLRLFRKGRRPRAHSCG